MLSAGAALRAWVGQQRREQPQQQLEEEEEPSTPRKMPNAGSADGLAAWQHLLYTP